MAKLKNQRIWSTDHDLLKRLADEQENYIGRDYDLFLNQGLLVIYALPRRYKSKVETKRKDKFEKRERRSE